MDIFDFAMKMEKDGEQYYRELAEKSKISGLKQIFMLLAENEVEHFNVLKSLKENASPHLTGYTIVKDAKNIFTEMKENSETIDLEGTGTDLYLKAVEIEKKSETFYREKAAEVKSEEAAKLFLQIAEEECRHAYFMENMVIFLLRPHTWIENAEFNHLEDY